MVISWLKKVTQPKSTVTPPANGPTCEATPTTRSTSSAALELPHDKITQRAYEIWIRKGRPEGQCAQNWKEAEAELRAELTGRAPEPLPNRPR